MKHRSTADIAAQIAALGDGVRLRVARIVQSHELAVGEIGKVLQLPQSTVSRHLKALADAGWVRRRQEGTASLFTLVPDDLSPGTRAVWAALRAEADGMSDAADDDRRVRAVLAERRTDSQSFFGRVAGEWDAVRNDLFGVRFTSHALLALLRKDWVVADLGCGTGNAAELLAPFVRHVFAVDNSPPMLAAAKDRLRGVKNVTFVESSVEKSMLPDRGVDAVVSVLLLHHLDDPVVCLREARRTLRTNHGGGTMLVVDMLAHSRDDYRRTMGHRHLGFSPQRMREMFRAGGFADTTYHELPGDPDGKGPGLFVATATIE